MIVDYHTHTFLCKHAEGDVDDYVLRALELGFDEIGCSEHIPMPGGFDEKHRMSLEEYVNIYAPSVSEIRERYKSRIRVRRGIEADFFPGTEDWVRGFIKEHDFDFVIGSVHFLGSWGFDDIVFVHQYSERDVDSVYEQYFQAVRKSAASGLFDVIAHCDLVKKFGHRPTKSLRDLAWETLREIKKAGLCIEINTSGLRKPVKEIYPSDSILEMIRELAIPLTLGSDAHSPGDVGRDFDRAVALIERYGGGHIAVFEGRERREVRVSRVVPA
ncbi:MAG: histidinol-phosphatase HisJ [Ignavibacteriales bacterium]|nr:histidinol-phosphatase HisJ [Ignavibacteriales bacterium]